MLSFLAATLSTCQLDCQMAQKAAAACAGRSTAYLAASNTLCLSGRIDAEGRLRATIKAFALRRNLTVVMTSEGGDADVAMDIAEHLARFGYDAVVSGMCASACAQFLFMAASRRTITGEGVVAMHGGPMTAEQIEALPFTGEAKAKIRATNNRFLDFYRARDIDIRITNGFPERLLKQLREGKIVFWIPKEEDFSRYGVAKLNYCNSRYRDPDNVRPAAKP